MVCFQATFAQQVVTRVTLGCRFLQCPYPTQDAVVCLRTEIRPKSTQMTKFTNSHEPVLADSLSSSSVCQKKSRNCNRTNELRFGSK